MGPGEGEVELYLEDKADTAKKPSHSFSKHFLCCVNSYVMPHASAVQKGRGPTDLYIPPKKRGTKTNSSYAIISLI